jgi:integral membrane protein
MPIPSRDHIVLSMVSWMRSPVARFRVAAIAEAWSWAGLLIGMFFKYIVVHNDIGVKIMGPIHGALFVLYCVCVLDAMRHLRQPAGVTLLGLAAAVPPFTTIWFERFVLRRVAAQQHMRSTEPAP